MEERKGERFGEGFGLAFSKASCTWDLPASSRVRGKAGLVLQPLEAIPLSAG